MLAERLPKRLVSTWLDHAGAQGPLAARLQAGSRLAHLGNRDLQQQAGLYFVGEVLDITGGLGGYNFQWAWSSGFSADRAIDG